MFRKVPPLPARGRAGVGATSAANNRSPKPQIPMLEIILMATLSFALLGYLLYALLKPENF